MAINRIVEIHTHMFNGLYVPIEEVLNHGLGIPRGVAVPVGGILKLIIKEKLTPVTKGGGDWLALSREIAGTAAYAKTLTQVVKKKIRDDLEGDDVTMAIAVKASSALLLDHVTELFTQHHLLSGEVFDAGGFRRDVEQDLTVARDDPKEEIERKKRLDNLFDRELYGVLKKYLRKSKEYLEFFCKMMVEDKVLCDTLLNKNYTPAHQPALTVHLTMDIEPAYWSINENGKTIPCEYDFVKKQIKRSSGFIQQARGSLLGFVAYHPARGTKGIDDCFEALYRGHVGIKIYPPLNYRPDGEPMQSGKKYRPVPDYKAVLEELYDKCLEGGIPIITHCTPKGFEAWKGTGPLSNPDYWENVLRNRETLRLGFGHAGGGHFKYPDHYQERKEIDNKGWYSHQDDWVSTDCYARKISELCRRYPNVYADFSYLNEIMFEKKWSKRFVANLKREVEAPGGFADKIMYGSDWHMPALLKNTEELLAAFKEVLREADLPADLEDKFLFRNTIRFLNLPAFFEREFQKPFLKKEDLTYLKKIEEMARGADNPNAA